MTVETVLIPPAVHEAFTEETGRTIGSNSPFKDWSHVAQRFIGRSAIGSVWETVVKDAKDRLWACTWEQYWLDIPGDGAPDRDVVYVRVTGLERPEVVYDVYYEPLKPAADDGE